MHGFSDDERDEIREELVKTARELVVRYGPAKTNIDDITDPVGIAKSTFYRFFDSKADLYLEILLREHAEITARAEAEVAGVDDLTEGLERLFRVWIDYFEAEPLMRISHSDTFERLLRSLDRDVVAAAEREIFDRMEPILDELHAADGEPFVELTVGTVMGLLWTVEQTVIHSDEFDDYEDDDYGDTDYEHIRDVFVTALARGLTTTERS